MFTRLTMLSVLMLLPMMAEADKGKFEFLVGTQRHIFAPSCIKSLQYVTPGKTDSESLGFQLTDACAERMSAITHENIGKPMTIAYEGNTLYSGMIIQNMKYGFRVSAADTSRVVLLQVIRDYGIPVE